MGAALLVPASGTIYSAVRLLDFSPAGLGVGAVALRLDATRVCICQGVLGLRAWPPWGAVRAGIFSKAHLSAAGVLLRPSIVVDIGNLQFGLFTRPRYSHYYFGDYYDNVYIGG